jgi:hypothetical protein
MYGYQTPASHSQAPRIAVSTVQANNSVMLISILFLLVLCFGVGFVINLDHNMHSSHGRRKPKRMPRRSLAEQIHELWKVVMLFSNKCMDAAANPTASIRTLRAAVMAWKDFVGTRVSARSNWQWLASAAYIASGLFTLVCERARQLCFGFKFAMRVRDGRPDSAANSRVPAGNAETSGLVSGSAKDSKKKMDHRSHAKVASSLGTEEGSSAVKGSVTTAKQLVREKIDDDNAVQEMSPTNKRSAVGGGGAVVPRRRDHSLPPAAVAAATVSPHEEEGAEEEIPTRDVEDRGLAPAQDGQALIKASVNQAEIDTCSENSEELEHAAAARRLSAQSTNSSDTVARNLSGEEEAEAGGGASGGDSADVAAGAETVHEVLTAQCDEDREDQEMGGNMSATANSDFTDYVGEEDEDEEEEEEEEGGDIPIARSGDLDLRGLASNEIWKKSEDVTQGDAGTGFDCEEVLSGSTKAGEKPRVDAFSASFVGDKKSDRSMLQGSFWTRTHSDSSDYEVQEERGGGAPHLDEASPPLFRGSSHTHSTLVETPHQDVEPPPGFGSVRTFSGGHFSFAGECSAAVGGGWTERGSEGAAAQSLFFGVVDDPVLPLSPSLSDSPLWLRSSSSSSSMLYPHAQRAPEYHLDLGHPISPVFSLMELGSGRGLSSLLPLEAPMSADNITISFTVRCVLLPAARVSAMKVC